MTFPFIEEITTHWKKIFLPLLLTACSFSAWAQTELATIPSLNVPRYMGTWYDLKKMEATPHTLPRVASNC